MPYTAGVFSLYTPGNPVVTGSTISSTWANSTLTDISSNGLSNAILKDGTQTATAAISFAQGINVTAAASTFYVTSSYTGTITGCTVAGTGTIRYTLLGNIVSASIPSAGFSGTSNATSKTITGMPAALWPVHAQLFYLGVIDNGATQVLGTGLIGTDGVITLSPSVAASASSWTNSGSFATAGAVAFTYTLA